MATKARIFAGTAAGASAGLVLAMATPLINKYEGTRVVAYRDPVGIITACTGHTDKALKLGQTFTVAQCGQTLNADERAALARDAACTHGSAPIETWAAMVVFSFNVGSAPYCKNFAPMIDKGDLAGACKRLSLYTYAGGKQLPGLIERRAAERALCEQGLIP